MAMKKISYILLLASAAATFTACSTSDDDKIFDMSAAERLNAAEAKYSTLLTNSQYGWAFEYYPTDDADDGALLYAVKFNADGTVVVAGDRTGDHIIQHQTSLWDIILDQGPVLSFSTYNSLIHFWSDPNPNYPYDNGDGNGYKGDYEFSFVYDASENQDSVISLRGKKRGLKSRLKMIDEDVTPEEYLLDCDAVVQKNFPTNQRNYSRLVIGSETYRVDGMKSSVAIYYPFGSDPTFFGKNNAYLLAKYGGTYWMRFNNPFTNSDGTLEEQTFRYDPVLQQFIGTKGCARLLPPHFATLFVEGLLNSDVTNMRIVKSSEMGETFKTLWTNAETALKAKNNTLNEVGIQTKNVGDNSNITITLKYKPRTGAAAEMFYKFNANRDGDKVTLSYVEPFNTGAQNVLNNFPACEKLIKAFEGTYTFTNPGEVQFNVVQLKATSTTDPQMAFSMSLTYPTESTAEK